MLTGPVGGLMLALAGGVGFSHEDGWSFAPPILSFCEKRECAVHGGREKTGARKKYCAFSTNNYPRGVARAGVLEVDELILA